MLLNGIAYRLISKRSSEKEKVLSKFSRGENLDYQYFYVVIILEQKESFTCYWKI